MGSTFGSLFRISTWGESHGPAIGVVIDGCPPGLPLEAKTIQHDLDRRRPGQSAITTQRREGDEVEILSGVFEGKTTGTPISLMIKNADQRSRDYAEMKAAFRPSHADFTYQMKYGIRDYAGGGRSSARETIGRVAAGAIARQLLGAGHGVVVRAFISQIHDIEMGHYPTFPEEAAVESNPVRCPDPEVAERMIERIKEARDAGDSVGGIIECRIAKVPLGWGEPVFDRLEADLAKAMLSLPATKGFEIGSGFAGSKLRGSEHNDLFENREGEVRTRTNRAGGVLGGISSGEEICFRVAFKPTATLIRKQETVATDGTAMVLQGKGRHDPCVVPRAVPIVEAMAALVLVDHWMRHTAQCRLVTFD
ncbi:MAG: chorismate synthase [Puniceicoccaceae bacterium]